MWRCLPDGGIVMRKTFAVVVYVILAVALLTGCSSSQGLSTPGAPSRDTDSLQTLQSDYRDVELRLFTSVGNAPDTVTVRFYEEMPDVPYIGLAHYMALVFGDQAKVEVRGNVATITSTDGGVAVIDGAADTFVTGSWSLFHNYLKPMQQGKMQGFIDYATPFCRISSLDYEKQGEPLVFDFSKYGIDLHVDTDDAYFPLATASVLMADAGFNNLACNGRVLCLITGLNSDPRELDPAWYEPVFADEPRPQDLVDFTYNELCFVIDNIYSCNGKSILSEDIAAAGLDAALAGKDGVTQRVRELIRSTDKAEFFAGMCVLSKYLYNGHTLVMDLNMSEDTLGPELYNRISAIENELDESFVRNKDYIQKLDVITLVSLNEAKAQRSRIWSDGSSYHEQGDTAVISLDSFYDYDREGWDAYYAGTGERPDGSEVPDIVGTLASGLGKAGSNPRIKYVVIDDSANNGGSNDLCATVATIITGRSKTPLRDVATGQRYTITYDIDTLFDGSFDFSAAASVYDFKYAVLTSCSSWSAGNYLPSLLRDAGIPVIGETSSGGTDMVAQMIGPDGQFLVISNGCYQMTDAEGNNIENGVPVDVELVVVDADGKKDYSAFYDIGRLSEVMHGLYSE